MSGACAVGDAAENLPDLEPLLTAEDVAPLFRVKPKTIYKMIEEGTLGPEAGLRRIGRRIRFYRPRLVAFLAGQGSARKGK